MRPPIFDLHCDTLDRLTWHTLPTELQCGDSEYAVGRPVTPGLSREAPEDLRHASGSLALDRMAAYQWCQCFAVFVPDELSLADAVRFFDIVSGTLAGQAEQNADMLAVATDARDVQGILDAGKTCGLLTIEGGNLLGAAPDMVQRVARRGVKMITLTWNAENCLGSGHDTHRGLTSLGRTRIAEMEEARIVVDVSHLNDEGFADLLTCAKRPFAASHSNSRAIHDVPRNLTDDQFRALRDAGGIVGINYYFDFVNGVEQYEPEALFTHIDHFLDLGGEDVVSLGSDFDGSEIPSWLDGCEHVQKLVDLLQERYGADLARKICFQNAHDFFVRNEG